MADYLDVVQFKERDGKWRPNRLGYAKKNDKGQLNVYFDVMPIPDHEGSVRFVIQKPQERDSQQSAPSNGSNAAMSGREIDDDIPFQAEWRG